MLLIRYRENANLMQVRVGYARQRKRNFDFPFQSKGGMYLFIVGEEREEKRNWTGP